MTRLKDLPHMEQVAFVRRSKAAWRDYSKKSDERYVDGMTLLGVHPLSWAPVVLRGTKKLDHCQDCAHWQKFRDGREFKQRCAVQDRAPKQKTLKFAGLKMKLFACSEYVDG